MQRFPAVRISLIEAHGLRNDASWPHVDAAIVRLENALATDGFAAPTEDEVAISSWFGAYRSFGTNPRRFKPSVYALLRRLDKSRRLPRITSAVDAYNLVSVTHRVPAGAFDVDKLTGDVEIRFARPADAFTPLGEPEVEEVPNDGEVVYASGSEVLTRHWNFRDSDRTKLDQHSRSAVYMLEAVSQAMSRALDAATDELLELLRRHGASASLHQLSRDQPSAVVTPA